MEQYDFELSENALRLKCENETIAAICFSIENSPDKHLYLHHIASKEKQKGHYSMLFKEVEKIARQNECKSLRMKTGTSPEYHGIIAMHRNYGFKNMEQTELDKQRGRIGLEKTL